MQTCLLTGAAGFIGSTLCEALLAKGYAVKGIDSFTDYYDRALKEKNVAGFRDKIEFVEGDLLDVDLKALLSGVDTIFHLAAQAGVLKSWGENFKLYLQNNIAVTQRLLETLKEVPIRRLVYASTSSVYGQCRQLPLKEDAKPQPISPYGVSKLTCEHLLRMYETSFGIPSVSLRYFTVYGPRQRPDMAFNKFFHAIRDNHEIQIYGDGEQTRDFTFVDDIVQGTIKTAEADNISGVFNIGGGSRMTVNAILEMFAELTGKEPLVKYIEPQKGDMRDTHADITRARDELAYDPQTDVRTGLRKELEWLRENVW